MVPAAVYGLHFPFSAFNLLWVFLLPNRVLSPHVCLPVGASSLVDLAGRPQAGAPLVVKPMPSPSSEGNVNEEEGGCGRPLRFPERGSGRGRATEFMALSFVPAAAGHRAACPEFTCPVYP